MYEENESCMGLDTPQRESELSREVDRLDKAVIILNEKIGSLAIRLKPVLTSESPKNSSESKDVSVQTIVGKAIRKSSEGVFYAESIIADLLSRLEI